MQQLLKKIVIIKSLIVVLCVVGLFCQMPETQAATKAFDVTTIIPDNQVDKNSTYFDLKLGAEQEQTLEVVLRNVTDKKITVVADFNRQTTNSNGVIEYTATNDRPDKSLEIDIESLVILADEEIVIKPKGEEKVKILVKGPEKDFDGVLAGGLTFNLKPGDKQELLKQESDNAGVENSYGYEVALIINGNQPANELPSELKLSTVGIIYEDGLNQIFANLQNPQAKFLYGVEIESVLTKKDSQDVVLKQTRDNLQVAPNSNFNYGMYLNGTVLEAGTYTLSLAITMGTEQVDFKKDVKIKQAEAEKTLEEASPVTQNGRTIWYVLICLASILIVIIVWVIISHVFKTKTQRRIAKQKRKKRRKR